MRAAARVRLGMWHAVGPAVSSDPSNGVLLAIGAAGLLMGAALLAGPIGLGYVCLSAGLGLFGLGAAASVARQPETGSAEGEISRVRLLGERLERGVERLKDLQWQIRDDENRYRDLLDSQSDLITRTDAQGRLTFVNRAFCRTFGVEAGAVLGTTFRFDVLQGNLPTANSPNEPARRLRAEAQIMTLSGARWFVFEQHAVAEAEGAVTETQAIARDITDQRRIEAELAAMRDQALAANSAKSRFLAAMSHEIRTPMNGILGMTELLMDSGLSAEQRSYAHAIDHSAKTLLTIIDEILDLSKIEAGKLEIHPVQFPVDHCVQSVIELLAPKAFEKGLELVWRIEPGLPSILVGDETRVRQILLNLVGNAIKFTDHGGIVVRVASEPIAGVDANSRKQMRLVLEVRDTGVGIPPDQLPTLFSEFEQAEDTIRRKRGGTGLGLAISRRLAKAMRGDIDVTTAPGKGSTFRAHMQLGIAESARPLIETPAHPEACRVLLALDQRMEKDVLAASLASISVPVTLATTSDIDVALAAAAVEGRAYEAVLVDAAAGPQGGRVLLAKVRAASDRPVRGVVLIDQLGRKSLAEFRTAGFDAYLIRPVRPLSLLSQLGLIATSDWPAPAREVAVAIPDVMRKDEALRARRILLVEDNDINALLARRVSERAGCTVVHARNGREALAQSERQLQDPGNCFDLVLMDIHMPEMDGFEATSRLKRLYAGAATRVPPIVALTANAFAEDRKRCLEAGLDDFLAKPFDRSELEALLDKWCGVATVSREGTLAELVA